MAWPSRSVRRVMGSGLVVTMVSMLTRTQPRSGCRVSVGAGIGRRRKSASVSSGQVDAAAAGVDLGPLAPGCLGARAGLAPHGHDDAVALGAGPQRAGRVGELGAGAVGRTARPDARGLAAQGCAFVAEELDGGGDCRVLAGCFLGLAHRHSVGRLVLRDACVELVRPRYRARVQPDDARDERQCCHCSPDEGVTHGWHQPRRCATQRTRSARRGVGSGRHRRQESCAHPRPPRRMEPA